MSQMHFYLSKCRMSPKEWLASMPKLVIGSKVVVCVDHFIYVGSLISHGKLVSDVILTRTQKSRLYFPWLWCRWDISLLGKRCVWWIAAGSIPFYVCEKWPLKMGDICRSLAFDHRFLRISDRILLYHQVNSSQVRHAIRCEDWKWKWGTWEYQAVKMVTTRIMYSYPLALLTRNDDSCGSKL